MQARSYVPRNMVIVSPALYQVVARRADAIRQTDTLMGGPFVGRLFNIDVCINAWVEGNTIHGQDDTVRQFCRILGWHLDERDDEAAQLKTTLQP